MKPDNKTWLLSTKMLLSPGMFAVLLVLAVGIRRPGQSATFFRLMGERYQDLLEASDGLQRSSGVRLVGWWRGGYVPAGNADDLGLYILVPEIGRVFHLQMATAYDATCWTLIALTAIVGGLGVGTLNSRTGVLFAAALLLTARAGDVYVFQALPALAGVPWLFRFGHQQKMVHLAIACTAVAFAAGICSLFRNSAGLPYVAMLVMIVAFRYPKMKAAILAGFVFCVFAVPRVYEDHLLRERDNFLMVHGAEPGAGDSHLLWHAIYLGLAWIPNSEVPRYQDEVAIAKAKSIDPAAVYPSRQYEHIMRSEVFSIAKQKPWIIVVNVLAKLTVILIMLAVPFVLSYGSFRRRPLELWFDGSFILAMAIGVLPGVLVIPHWPYVLGGLCAACLYSGFSVQLAADPEHAAHSREGKSGLK